DFFSWRIPLPTFEEQRRVAAQLRAFDALANDLRIGLPAELAARRQQYEYYRNRLLTFREVE
ncbi:restriction endonuclease subunit S, partial [Escherichia coli]|nr:restriction endonuclease subunit S [Escherichia coli]